MSVARLQESIRRSKTPVALVLGPDEARMHPKYLKSFTDMYGDCPMAHAEALRFHGSQAIGAAAGKLPAVLLRAEPYLAQGFMGMDVLANLVNMAKNKGLYTIVDARCAGTEPWLHGGVNADAVTVLPKRRGGGLRAEPHGRRQAGVSGGRGADDASRRGLHGGNGLQSGREGAAPKAEGRVPYPQWLRRGQRLPRL